MKEDENYYGMSLVEIIEYNSKVSKALGNLALEGISISPELLEDLKLVWLGKINEDELVKRAITRAKPEKIDYSDIPETDEAFWKDARNKLTYMA